MMRNNTGINKSEALKQYEHFQQEALQADAIKRKLTVINHYLEQVPIRFKELGFDNYKIVYPEQSMIKKVVERYVTTFQQRFDKGDGLLFTGLPGTGKTMLSLIIYQYLAKAGFTVKYQPSLHFLKLLHEKQFESSAQFRKELDYLVQPQLLIIDEASTGCGKNGFPAGWERELLFTIINERYQNEKPILVISNHNTQQLIERVGEATVDRLSESVILAFDWGSFRKKPC
jgi:DNA replication protein DnaC